MSRRWLLICAAIAITLVSGVLGVYVWATQPAVSRPTDDDNNTAVMGTSTMKTTRDVAFTTKFFTTKISEGYVTRDHTERTNAGFLDRYLLVSPVEAGSDQTAITIGKLPREGVRSISDVIFRQQNKEIYNPVQLEDLPEGSVAFVSRQNGYEISVFMPHVDKYAAVVMSGRPDREVTIRDQLKSVVTSWQWL